MGNHDDFDLDVRLGNGRSSMGVSQPQDGDIFNDDPTNADQDTCNMSCGGTCDDADTCANHNTCHTCDTCAMSCGGTCDAGQTCGAVYTCEGTCATCQLGDTCRTCETCEGHTCIGHNCDPPQ